MVKRWHPNFRPCKVIVEEKIHMHLGTGKLQMGKKRYNADGAGKREGVEDEEEVLSITHLPCTATSLRPRLFPFVLGLGSF
jgi:hypothetical protein